MVHYLELQSNLTLQSLNFKEIRLIEGQLLTDAEVDKLIDKIGIIRYISQVKHDACKEVSLKRSNICFKDGIRKRK